MQVKPLYLNVVNFEIKNTQLISMPNENQAGMGAMTSPLTHPPLISMDYATLITSIRDLRLRILKQSE